MNNIDQFRTIKEESAGKITEKRSKFLSFAYHVQSVDECEILIDEMRKKYYDATHVVWAYRLRSGQEKCTDDREPSNSAGPPALNAIKKMELFDVIVFDVRYFGGIKLGVGGLIRAYYDAAYDALENAEIITVIEKEQIEIPTTYEKMSSVINKVNRAGGQVLDISYDSGVTVKARIRKRDAEPIRELKDFYKQ